MKRYPEFSRAFSASIWLSPTSSSGAQAGSGSERLARVGNWLRSATVLGLLLASSLMGTGCGKPSLAVHDSDAFQAAAPELKTAWQTAVAAAKTNGYLVAYSTLQNLRSQPGLAPEQAKAVEELFGVVGTRMFNAANNGDPEATKALKEVQNTTKRR